jgi:D-methionine transport system ATP-binding protein
MNQLITIENLTFAYQKNKPFFKQFSATFTSGKLHVITGKNGAGKSTLFQLLHNNTLHKNITSGNITIGKKSFNLTNAQQSALVNNHVQAVPQKCALMLASNFTFNENLTFSQLAPYPSIKRLPKGTIPFSKFFNSFHIDPNQKIKELSGGQQQMCAILMALSQPTADILLLDEPTAALDHKSTQLLMQFLEHITKELSITIFMISHDQDIINSMKTYSEIIVNNNETRILLTHKNSP